MEDDPDTFARERVFHSAVREYILFLLLFLLLYGASYCLTSKFRKRKDDLFSDEDDAIVHRISLWMCNFCLAVSFGAALLLPMSIIANEVLHLYPQSQYMEWLNSSLIQGLWNAVFLFSNMGVFMLLPFAYLFTESEGLPGTQRGLAARVYETFLVLSLLGLVVVGLTYMISTLINYKHQGIKSFFTLWNVYLPFLYSCVSCLGVFTLLVCTPIGFGRLFSVIGNLIIKPKFFRDLKEECYIAVLEEENLKRKQPVLNHYCRDSQHNGIHNMYLMQLYEKDTEGLLQEKLRKAEKENKVLHQQQRVSTLRRNLGYPVAMLLLLFLTAISVLIVVQNTLELLVGIKALPLYTQQFSLGISSLSALGPPGAAIELTLILYLWLASMVGFYTLPIFTRLKPRLGETSMTQIIGNCAVLLILSSALPVLARILGITNFDLLGDFGRIEWLGQFWLVLLYNIVFAVATGLCLVTIFTKSMRQELFHRLVALQFWKKAWDKSD